MKQLSKYTDFLKALKLSLIENFRFSSDPELRSILRNQRLLIVINHSTPLSWIPAISCLALEAEAAGGGQRIPRGIVDRWFYTNPLTAIAAEYVSQSPRPQSFEEILESFVEADNTDLVLFPEGANCFFGDPNEVQDFRSSRFIEIAIRAKCPILLVTHWGSESWAKSLPLPKEWGSWLSLMAPFFGPQLSRFGAINLPLIGEKIKMFSMSCKLWVPSLYEADLSEHQNERKLQLENEAKALRQEMSLMLEELKRAAVL